MTTVPVGKLRATWTMSGTSTQSPTVRSAPVLAQALGTFGVALPMEAP